MFLSLDTIPGLKGQVSAPEENVKEKPEFSGAFGIYAVKNMEPSQGKASISRFFFFEATYQFPKDRHFHPF